jgi:hypothetical protein
VHRRDKKVVSVFVRFRAPLKHGVQESDVPVGTDAAVLLIREAAVHVARL